MPPIQPQTEILIIGAGLAGLTAATALQQAGHEVVVIDKGRGAGGRLASRRIGPATFDYGAQFMTVREPRFAAAVEQWANLGLAEEWYRSGDTATPGHPRWRGKPTMRELAKHLAHGLTLHQETQLASLRRAGKEWVARMEGGEEISATAVVMTPPVPQSLALLDAGGVELPPTMRARLEQITYERCFAVLAVLDGPSRIPPPGAISFTDGPIAWLADNQAKGVSATPAVTLHATAEYSLAHWERDRQETGKELLAAAQTWLGAEVIEFQVHGWRYSKPLHIDDSGCFVVSESPWLLLAGDAFVGARVEGAALSGWLAADKLAQSLQRASPTS